MAELSPKTYTILEAGFAGAASIGVPGRRQLLEGQHYIGLGTFDYPNEDQQARDAAYFQDLLNKVLPGHRSVMRGSITELPFADSTMDEVIVANLFGDPRFARGSRTKAASEIARVLRPEGTATIIETISPTVMPLDALRDLMGEHGLQQANQGLEHDPQILADYSNVQSSLGYVATFNFQTQA